MPIKIINPIGDNRWLEFIKNIPGSTIFYHTEWLRIINKQYNYPVFAVCSFDTKGNINAGIPFFEINNFLSKTKWISLPFTDYCSPLFDSVDHLENVYQYLINSYREKKVDYIEIRSNKNTGSGFKTDNGFVGHLLKINNSSETVILKSFDRQRVQGINKANKEGLTPAICTDLESVEKFYALHLNTRKKKGIPVQPKNFFIELHKNIINKDLGFIIIIYLKDIPVAAGLFLIFNKALIYKYNASDSNYLSLRPNNLIIWQGVKECIKRGLDTIDFGRTEKDNKGLREFKNGFGTIEFPINYSFYPDIASSRISIMKKIVSPVIQHSPSFICRTLGQLAYKYFP